MLIARRFAGRSDTFELMGSSMTAVHNTKSATTRRSRACDDFCGGGLCFHAQPLGGALVVSVIGELDASNVDRLNEYAKACLTDRNPFILDFSQMNFFGAQGVKSLFAIADQCDHDRRLWSVIPGREVTRLLRICDKDAKLPTAGSIDDALEGFSAMKRARRLLQLVTKSG